MTNLFQSRGSMISRFRALPSWEQKWLIQTVCWLPVVVILLRLLGLRRCVSLGGRTSKVVGAEVWVETAGYQQVDRVDRAALLTAAAARHGLARGTCLSRSLTLWWMLRSRGIQGSLRIGVRKPQQRLEAHAWVEYEDRILGDSSAVRLKFIPIGTWGDRQIVSDVLAVGDRAL